MRYILIILVLAALLALSACGTVQPRQYGYEPTCYKSMVTFSVVTDRGEDKAGFKQLIRTLCDDQTADACTVWLTEIRDHAIIYIAEPTDPISDSATRLMGHEAWHAVRCDYHKKRVTK